MRKTVRPETKNPVTRRVTGFSNNGGEIGIRTLGTGEGTTDFESVFSANKIYHAFPKTLKTVAFS
ncbi:hypothetical protein ALP74_200119 [Pseudomonas coronafaciens pv. garcae]|uniref:Uncharacterized protein n=1 Tax=Pseudomonas coronafaciens pv. garcae TaxID=251653 RepID=A0AB37QRK0_9PSED|nr:hypothetical protein ALP74_200119 [Pseudomonas coronafaciens pv. garcae]